MPQNKAKTLILLTPGFPENEADTACLSHIQMFVKALKENYPSLDIIILSFQYPFYSKEYDWFGIKVFSFGYKRQSRALNLLTGPRVLSKLKQFAGENELVGILSLWFGKCAAVGDKFSRKHNVPHYAWVLGQDAKPGNKYLKKVKPGNESLFIVSDFIANNLYQNYGIFPRHIVPMGIEPSLFNHEQMHRHIDILGAGSLTELKQYRVFLDVVALVKRTIPDIKAAICGEGPDGDDLLEKAKEMGLENNVFFAGSIPHHEVLEMMHQAKILLHPSNYEGFSTVCMEAICAGAKVISRVQPMAAGIENWFIAPDKGGMAEKAAAILLDDNITYQSAAPYTVANSAKTIMDLFGYYEPKVIIPEYEMDLA